MANSDDITAIPQKLSPEEIDVLPAFDSSLLLKPKEEIRFCDYMLHWMQSSRKSIDTDTYLLSKTAYIHFFADKSYSLTDVEYQPYFVPAYYEKTLFFFRYSKMIR